MNTRYVIIKRDQKVKLFKKFLRMNCIIVCLIACSVTLGTLAGCGNKISENCEESEIHDETGAVFLADVTSNNCFLCSETAYPYLPEYHGQKNIGVVCLNTLDFTFIELNRYDERGMPQKTGNIGENTRITFNGDEFSKSITSDSRRGLARGYINVAGNEKIDIKAAEEHLCTDCLNNIINQSTNSKSGIVLINFESGEIRLISMTDAAIMMGDFYFSYNMRNTENEDPKLEFIAFYCPERY